MYDALFSAPEASPSPTFILRLTEFSAGRSELSIRQINIGYLCLQLITGHIVRLELSSGTVVDVEDCMHVRWNESISIITGVDEIFHTAA
jgi:hypothetical protein